MPACVPRHGCTNGLVRANFGSSSSRPSRGAKPREADDTKTSLGAASPGWLSRSGVVQARCTLRGSHDVSHDDQGQAGASGSSVPVSPLVTRRQAHAWNPENQARFPYRCNKSKTAETVGQRSSRSPPWCHHQRLSQVKTSFVRISCTSCPPSNLAVVGSLPFLHLGRGPMPL